MKEINKPVFVANDGIEFENKLDCEVYEHMQEVSSNIDTYIEISNIAEGKAPRFTTQVKNRLMDYERFMFLNASGVYIPQKKETQEEMVGPPKPPAKKQFTTKPAAKGANK